MTLGFVGEKGSILDQSQGVAHFKEAAGRSNRFEEWSAEEVSSLLKSCGYDSPSTVDQFEIFLVQRLFGLPPWCKTCRVLSIVRESRVRERTVQPGAKHHLFGLPKHTWARNAGLQRRRPRWRRAGWTARPS